jgi:hypothetical protein
MFDLVNQIIRKRVQLSSHLAANHMVLYRTANDVGVQHRSISMKKLAIDLMLVQNVIRLIQQPRKLGAGQNHLRPGDEVRQDEYFIRFRKLVMNYHDVSVVRSCSLTL